MTFVSSLGAICHLSERASFSYNIKVNHNIFVEKSMISHNQFEISESEEMYLITIARLVERGVEEPVPISLLAAELSIQPVSANQMVHKLAEEELLEYLPYKGVQLTGKGQEVALQVLRDRRLWEVFLAEHLELPPSEADALACRLEHITPNDVTCRLANYLGHPSVTPQGLPIPEVNGKSVAKTLHPLTDLTAGERGEVMRIEGDRASRTFLETEGLRPGVEVFPLAIGGGGSILLRVGENRIHLTETVASKILVNLQTDRTLGSEEI